MRISLSHDPDLGQPSLDVSHAEVWGVASNDNDVRLARGGSERYRSGRHDDDIGMPWNENSTGSQ